jgi:hypothetical protein
MGRLYWKEGHIVDKSNGKCLNINEFPYIKDANNSTRGA